MRSIFTISLICWSFLANAQRDTLQNFNKWKPSFVRLGYDVARPIGSILSPNDFSQEISAEIDFHSLFLVAEGGFADLNKPGVGYESSGWYYRVGIDANLIPYDKLRNAILFSIRYAGSSFQQSLQTTFEDDFGIRNINISERNISSRWLEAGLGTKVRIRPNLYAGYSIRLRFGNGISGNEELLPAEIPGFGRPFNEGRNERGFSLGFHYGLYWKIPFWDKPVPIKKRKIPKVLPPPAGSEPEGQNQGINRGNINN